MAEKIVIGLFQSKGIAEDACNRLKYEGVPPGDIALELLRETTERPSSMDPEIAALSLDPLLLGKVRETYAPLIRNGETAVFVRAATEADVDLAAGTLKQYAPVRISVTTARELQAAAEPVVAAYEFVVIVE